MLNSWCLNKLITKIFIQVCLPDAYIFGQAWCMYVHVSQFFHLSIDTLFTCVCVYLSLWGMWERRQCLWVADFMSSGSESRRGITVSYGRFIFDLLRALIPFFSRSITNLIFLWQFTRYLSPHPPQYWGLVWLTVASRHGSWALLWLPLRFLW